MNDFEVTDAITQLRLRNLSKLAHIVRIRCMDDVIVNNENIFIILYWKCIKVVTGIRRCCSLLELSFPDGAPTAANAKR